MQSEQLTHQYYADTSAQSELTSTMQIARTTAQKMMKVALANIPMSKIGANKVNKYGHS
jgi:hypothetical protein